MRREGEGGFSVVVGNRYDAIITNCLESENESRKVRHRQEFDNENNHRRVCTIIIKS